MGISGILDIAIGLVFTYPILSLICTILNEMIATSLSLRGRQLNQALTIILDNIQIRKAFYNNGLIASSQTASRGGGDDTVTAWKLIRSSLWPGGRDALDARPSDPTGSGAPANGANPKPAVGATATGQPKDKEHPSYFDSRIFAMALLDSLDPDHQQDPAKQAGFPGIADIKASVEALPDSNIRDVLLANIATAGDDLHRLRENIAHWYDATMDRLSGDYKRETKKISLAIGLLIAVILNADSIAISRVLWADPTLRGQLVDAAQKTVDAKEISPTCGQPTAFAQPGTDPAIAKLDCLLQNLRDQDAKLRPLPLGWRASEFGIWFKDLNWWQSGLYGLGFVILKIVGLLWTGLALSLGAPFWFDILQKFMNIRGAGAKPQDSRSPKPTR